MTETRLNYKIFFLVFILSNKVKSFYESVQIKIRLVFHFYLNITPVNDLISVPDPFHFDMDPDPFREITDPDPAPNPT